MCSPPVILDIQGFFDDVGHLIPKEIAWCTLDFFTTIYALAAPPCPWDRLEVRSRVVNQWQTERIHGLPWDLPGLPHEQIRTLCHLIPSETSTIYINHPLVIQLLPAKLHSKLKVIDLSLRSLEEPPSWVTVCKTHAGCASMGKPSQCALTNILKIAHMLLRTQTPHPNIVKPAPTLAKVTKELNNVLIKDTIKYPEFQLLENRLHSYISWNSKHVCYKQLAHNGLFFSGEDDFVICYVCGKKIGLWLPGDNARNRHFLASPVCPLVKRLNFLLAANGPNPDIVINTSS